MRRSLTSFGRASSSTRSSTTSTTVRTSSRVWARLIRRVSCGGAAPKAARVSGLTSPSSHSTKLRIPAWATMPTQDCSWAVREAYQTWCSSTRREAAVARSPALRRTRRRVVRETRPRRDMTASLCAKHTKGLAPPDVAAESVGAELHRRPVQCVVLVVGGCRDRVGGDLVAPAGLELAHDLQVAAAQLVLGGVE